MTPVHHWQHGSEGQHVVSLASGEYLFGGSAAHGATVERLVSETAPVTETVTYQDGGDPVLSGPRRRRYTREVTPAKQVWETIAVENYRFSTAAGEYRITAGRGELNLCREEE